MKLSVKITYKLMWIITNVYSFLQNAKWKKSTFISHSSTEPSSQLDKYIPSNLTQRQICFDQSASLFSKLNSKWKNYIIRLSYLVFPELFLAILHSSNVRLETLMLLEIATLLVIISPLYIGDKKVREIMVSGYA